VRYTRHELKQDKFAESAAEAVHEVVQHRAGIIRIVAIVVVLALVACGIYWYMTSQEEQSADALGKAMLTYNAPIVAPNSPPQGATLTFHSDQERLIAAKNAFYLVSDQYGWTASGQFARYMAGVAELNLGNDKVAEEQLQAIRHSHRHQLAALAKYALASVYRNEKRQQDAIDLLQSLIDNPTTTVPKATSQLALAELYAAANQPDKAKVIFEQIVKDNPKNSLGEIAKEEQAAGK
jgi:tetratricopeptide (TPR) repeat protein